MAAIDPTSGPSSTATPRDKNTADAPLRATLKIMFDPDGPDDDEDDEDDEDLSDGDLGLDGNEEDLSSSDDEDTNGGPSDPSKSKKARKEAAAAQIQKVLAENGVDSEDDMDVDSSPKVNGTVSKKAKGKSKVTAEVEEADLDDEEEDDDDDETSVAELALCTLDASKNYQQPLDIVVGEDQTAFFKVTGDYDVYLTGNYVVDSSPRKMPGGYDLDPDLDELDDELDSDEESDELDDVEDPRITEIESEDEAPKLIKANEQGKDKSRGKNKRAAEESDDDDEEKKEAATLDDIMAKSLKPEEPKTNGEPKLSKKQLKKLKNNAGKAVEPAAENKDAKKAEQPTAEKSPGKGDKKVQFAKNLEQGPTGKPKDERTEPKSNLKGEETKKETQKPTLGVKTVQGVKVDDRKLGKGPAATKGDKVGLRYIGKLDDGKVFDGKSPSNRLQTPVISLSLSLSLLPPFFPPPILFYHN